MKINLKIKKKENSKKPDKKIVKKNSKTCKNCKMKSNTIGMQIEIFFCMFMKLNVFSTRLCIWI